MIMYQVIKELKRYTVFQDEKMGINSEETTYGDWVKWEDLVKFIEKDPNECNCDFFMRTQSGSWICPAHGYKKI
jgi:hypothetical protein